MLVGGCGEGAEPSPKTNPTDTAKAKPVKELTAEEKKVVGTYRGDTSELVFRGDRVCKMREIGEEGSLNCTWNVKNGEVVTRSQTENVFFNNSTIFYFRNESNGDLTLVASGGLKEGSLLYERSARVTNDYITYKKIK